MFLVDYTIHTMACEKQIVAIARRRNFRAASQRFRSNGPMGI